MHRGKDCVEKVIEHTEDVVKRFYAKFPHYPTTELNDVLEKEHDAIEKCCVCYTLRIKK